MSGHVVVIQSKPVITVYQTLRQITTLNSESQFVEVQACFEYKAKNFNKSISEYVFLYVTIYIIYCLYLF